MIKTPEVYVVHKVGQWERAALRNEMEVREGNPYCNEVPQKVSMEEHSGPVVISEDCFDNDNQFTRNNK